MASLTLTEEEIEEVTHYKLPKKQLEALQQMGIPARLRPHDNSVCVLRVFLTTLASTDRIAANEEPQLQSSRRR
jgi:hypothetical protein